MRKTICSYNASYLMDRHYVYAAARQKQGASFILMTLLLLFTRCSSAARSIESEALSCQN